ncbi:hypothetical protein VitviT2T_028552 [Vitis vinifera]|uniref:Uncharacterized protein n=1 Tax=Vitis vinifera TaxID=29760 RepID=A0ABY9DV32_VITVI|nr:hypothetical protein VitviT2T_028552 [Vitis vinifera]|eukprot:XP_010665102.1 PREDICTED: peamaclein [Vitis vinifera]
MATNKALTLVLVILCFVLVHELETKSGHLVTANAEKIDCKSKCAYRCSKAGWHKLCLRACNTCCERCNCVPPGTAGNEDVCPCYAKMTTHGGRHKCP